MIVLNKSYKLLSIISLFYSSKLSCLYLKNLDKIIFFFLPSYYFFKQVSCNKISFIFLNKFFFKSFISHLFIFYNKFISYYYIKFKMRGLGYRIRFISENLFSFFFNYTNFYYFYVPSKLLVKSYKNVWF